MKLSKLTISLGLYIVVSASFMRQAWEFITVKFGTPLAKAFCVALFVIAAFLILVHSFKRYRKDYPLGLVRAFKLSRGLVRIALNIVITAAAVVFAWQQPYFAEKMHILEYGLLGWLAAWDFQNCRKRTRQIISALLFISLISVLDEGFQKILPYRVGEIRDFITNIISGILGISLFLCR